MEKRLFIIPSWNKNYPKIFRLNDETEKINIDAINKINIEDYDYIKLFGESLEGIDENILSFFKKTKNKDSGTGRIQHLTSWCNMPYKTIMNKLEGTDKKIVLYYLDSSSNFREGYDETIKQLANLNKIENLFYPVRLTNYKNIINDIDKILNNFNVSFETIFVVEAKDDILLQQLSDDDLQEYYNGLKYAIMYNEKIKSFNDLFLRSSLKKSIAEEEEYYISPLSNNITKSFLKGYDNVINSITDNYYLFGIEQHFSTFFSDAVFNNSLSFSEENKQKYNNYIYLLKSKLEKYESF